MRAHFQRPLQDGGGNLLLDATVTVYEAGTLIPISATMYRSPDSDDELVNPFNPANGVISFFLDTPQSVAIGVRRGTGVETISDYLVVPRMSLLLDEEFRFSFMQTPLTAQTGYSRLYVINDCLVTSVRASLGVAADSDVTLDIRVNGTSIFDDTAPKPVIPAGSNTVVVPPSLSLAPLTAEDYLTADVVTTGTSAAPGNGVTIQVRTSREA